MSTCLGLGCAVAACGSQDGAHGTAAGGNAGADDAGAGESAGVTAATPPDDIGAPDASGEQEEGADSGPQPDLYDPAIIPEIELTFDAAAMAVLSNPDIATKDTWVHGSFRMGAITFADVGVRRKGSATFRALPQKASLKVKLNKWVSGQKVHGLTELTLNNMVNNSTFIAERLAFHAFRSLGLPASRVNTAHLKINGEDYGIYANIETPDKKFLARVFGAKSKTLYEVPDYGSAWVPGCEPGLEIDVADPDAPPGTLPDATALLQAVEAASDATLIADVAAHLHTTEWLRFSAAEAVTGDWDGYAYGKFGSHNYFMAGDTDGKFSLIPWSLDSTFNDDEGVIDAATPLDVTLLTRCKLGASCWSAYKSEVQSVVTAFEALDLVSLAKSWHDQIDPLVRSDPKREVSVEYYDQRTLQLYDWIQARPALVRAQLGI